MIYDASNTVHRNQARERLNKLIDSKKIFELKEKRQKRSIAQNSYLHLILTWFAMETGYTLHEAKQEIFKKIVNPDIFYEEQYEGKLVTVERWRSTARLNSKELTTAIDKFRHYSSMEAGIYLPEPSDLVALRDIEIEISRNEGAKAFI